VTDAGQPLDGRSRIVYSTTHMTLREDQFLADDGTCGTYSIVERPDFALIVPEAADRSLVLIQTYRYPVDATFWEFPQGGIEGSESAGNAAARELEEETGLRAGSLHVLGRLYEAYGYATSAFTVLHATGLEGDVSLAEAATVTVGHFTVPEVWRMVSAGLITDAPTVAALGLYVRGR
jgi:8-oxo-dGTP pyrophosphatase MutT (NUDIX family)